MYNRITKAKVKSMIKKDGKVTVNVCAHKLNPESPWGVCVREREFTSVDELDEWVTYYEVYNCNYKVGYYPAFYLEVQQ